MMTRKPPRIENSATLLLELMPVVLKDLRNAGDLRRAIPLTVPQLRTLSFIERNPACTLGLVAAHLGIGLPSASASVSRLAGKGLLEMNTPPDDRRSTALSLTPEGTQLVRQARALAKERISLRLKALSTDELRQLEESLTLLKACYRKS